MAKYAKIHTEFNLYVWAQHCIVSKDILYIVSGSHVQYDYKNKNSSEGGLTQKILNSGGHVCKIGEFSLKCY